MGRVLLIAIACVAGALVTWLFVPTIQPVGVNPDMPVFSRDDQSKPPANAQGAVSPMMSAEKRRSRAEQLVGTPLKYVTSGRVLTVDWITDKAPQAMERAMDECFLLTDETLFFQHIQALAEDGNDEIAGSAGSPIPHPSFSQMRSCKNVMTAYYAAHGKEFKF